MEEADSQLDHLRSSAEGKQGESSKLFGKSKTGSKQEWSPSPGEIVKLLSMGGKHAEVISLDRIPLIWYLGSLYRDSVGILKSLIM